VADIFNEIDEELRRDKAQEWWSRYGKIVIAVCAAIILSVAGYTLFEQQREKNQMALAEQFDAARLQASSDLTGAASALGAIAQSEDGSGTALIARFQQAGLLAESGDSAGAAGVLVALSQDEGVEPLYRDLAAVLGVLHSSQAGEDSAMLLEQLQPYLDDTSPWRHTARMLAASLQVGNGDIDAARDLLRQVADDPTAPGSSRGHAAEILQAINP